jgi:PIN domain nuclease of toxin-antitoxin system
MSEPARLGRRARALLDGAAAALVPAVSVWELAQLVREERVRVDRPLRDWVAQALATHPCRLAELSPEIAVTAVELGREGFHADPADRLIYATARVHGAPLLSADRLMRDFEKSLGARVPRLVVWD